MSTSKKLKSEQLFVRVETVMHDLQISRPFAYRMIAGWNEELKEQGYTFSVSASTRYHVESAPSPSTYYYLSNYMK